MGLTKNSVDARAFRKNPSPVRVFTFHHKYRNAQSEKRPLVSAITSCLIKISLIVH